MLPYKLEKWIRKIAYKVDAEGGKVGISVILKKLFTRKMSRLLVSIPTLFWGDRLFFF